MESEPLIAVCYRSPILALVALAGDRVLEVRRHRLQGGATSVATLRRRVERFARDLGTSTIVVEVESPVAAALESTTATLVVSSLDAARGQTLGQGQATHQELASALIRQHTCFNRFAPAATRPSSSTALNPAVKATLFALALGQARTHVSAVCG